MEEIEDKQKTVVLSVRVLTLGQRSTSQLKLGVTSLSESLIEMQPVDETLLKLHIFSLCLPFNIVFINHTALCKDTDQTHFS